MAWKWFWDTETKYYDEAITRDTDWGGDTSTGNIPVSGGRVQEWLKTEINGRFGFLNMRFNEAESMYYIECFTSEEDYILYNGDKDTYKDLLLQSVQIPISTVQGDTFTAQLRTSTSNTANIVVTEGKLEVPLNYKAVKITQIGNENAGYSGTVIIQTSTNGETWSTVGTIPNALPSSEIDDSTTYTKVDIGKYLTNGKQYVRLRAQYTYENEDGEEKTVNSSNVIIGNSVTKTSLRLELRTDFQTPMNKYNSNGEENMFEVAYYVYGIVKKTLHLEIQGSGGTFKTSQVLESTDDGISKTISISDTGVYGLLTHGVKKVTAWMEAEDGLGNTVKSNTLVNRFMMVDNTLTGDERLKPYLLLQNVDAVVTNYVQTEIAKYAVYSPKLNEDGTITNDGEDINIVFLLTDYVDKEYLRIEQTAKAGVAIDLIATVEIEQESDGVTVDKYDGYFKVQRIKGDETIDFLKESTGDNWLRIDVDNKNAITPIAGAVFFLNPKTRNNSESGRDKIYNARNNNAIVSSRFNNFGFINDGWITAEDGQKVLRIPAGATLEIDWDIFAKFRTTPQTSVSFMIDYKVSNVTDLNSPIINISEGTDSSFKGLRMNALDGWLCTASYNSKDDCLFSWQEDKRTHLAVNINHAVKPNNGDVYYPSTATNVDGTLPLARVLIDGKIEREIPFNTTNNAEWSTGTGKIVIGNPDADIDIYGIYVYEKQLEANEILNRNNTAAKPTSAEKETTRRRNDILVGGKIDIEKTKELGINSMIWHGAQTYVYNTSSQKGWYEIYRYDDNGKYLPEYSGTICKASKALEIKGQGSTAKTYYDWNQQDDISKMPYNFADGLNVILVALSDIHESIVVGTPYEGSIDEDAKKGGVYSGMVVDVYGGNLGKNFPIENKPKKYPYINGKVMFPDGWIDGNDKYRGLGYQVAKGVAQALKDVLKVNYASSMQSHLWGACNSYNDLHKLIVGDTPLQKVYPAAVSAKHTEPFMVFNQKDDSSPVVFRGMGNYGAGKMDKVAWGYVKSLHPMFALIEGSDNNLPMTGFRVPFTKDTAVYSPKDEGWKYAGQQSWDFDGGATTDDLGGWTTDGSTNDDGEIEVPKANIRDRWAEVHNFIYLHSTNLKYFYGTYEEFIKSEQAAKDTEYKYWCTSGDKAFNLYVYNHISKTWEKAVLTNAFASLKNYAPYSSAYGKWVSDGTGDYALLNQMCIEANVAHMKKHIKYFFNEKSLLFNYSYVLQFIAGTDNSDKNTYYKIMPYAEDFSADAETKDGKEFASWFKIHFGYDFNFSEVYQIYMDGDDMDSIFRTNNNSHQTKPYYIDRMHPTADDKPDVVLYEGMGNQLFNFIEKAYAPTGELENMMRQILVTMTTLVNEDDRFYGDVPVKKSAWGFLHKYFFNAQHYFPEVAYNEQARIRYEFPQLIGYISSGAGARNITPISQSLGSQLQNELQYMSQRLILMASYAGFGAFGGGGEIGIEDAKETFGFTPSAMPDGSPSTYTFTVKTHQYLYPAYTVGGTYYNTRNRCKPNTAFTFTMQGSFASSDTGLGICGINYYTDLGELNDKSITKPIIFNGNRLTALIITYNGGAFRPEQITLNCKNLKKVQIGPSNLTILQYLDLSMVTKASSIVLQGLIYEVKLPESAVLKNAVFPTYLKQIEFHNLPSLEHVNLVSSYQTLNKLVVGKNVNKLNLKDTVQGIYNSQHNMSTPTLQEISIQNVNWTDFDADVLEWYCGIPKCEFKGAISIKEDDQFGNPRITWDLKNKINAKFGVVDNSISAAYKGLLITYKQKAFDAKNAKIIGNYYPNGSRDVQFEVKPGNPYENNHTAITFTITDNSTHGYYMDRKGYLRVSSPRNEEHKATVTATINWWGAAGNVSKEIAIWNRPAQLGDLVYYDGTYQDPDDYDGEKTPIGVCFYLPPKDKDGNILTKFNNPNDKQLRLMVAMEDIKVLINGAVTSKLRWGVKSPIGDVLDSNNIKSALYDLNEDDNVVRLTSASIKVPSMYDIQAIRDIRTNGLDNQYTDPDPTTNPNGTSDYRDTNSEDGILNDGFKCVTPDMAVGDGFAYNEDNVNFDSVGERTLTDDLAKLAGSSYTQGDIVNAGYAKTLKIIRHRNEILNNDIIGANNAVILSGGTLSAPSATSTETEMKSLGRLIDNLINWAANPQGMNDPYPQKWQQLAYPFASACYAYEPTNLKSGEVLADKFKAHNWFAPTMGQILRICWFYKFGAKSGVDIFKGAREKGFFSWLLSDITGFWSVAENSEPNSWTLRYIDMMVTGTGKSDERVTLAISSF